MSTHDYVIANASGSAVRSDINNVLAAIVSNNSSSSEPSTKYAYMLWVDTTNNLIKLRNSANNSWITLFTTAGGLDVDAASNFNEDVTFTGASANVTWDKSADDLIFNDNAKAAFGTGSDLQLYHDETNSYINNATGDLYIQSDGNLKIEAKDGGDDYIHCIKDGSVELHWDGNKKFETTSTGITVTGKINFDSDNYIDCNTTANTLEIFLNGGQVGEWGANLLKLLDDKSLKLGTGNDLEIKHNGTSGKSIIYHTHASAVLSIAADHLNLADYGNEHPFITCDRDGAVELYYDNVLAFKTGSNGNYHHKHCDPYVADSFNLGHNYRWKTLYTNNAVDVSSDRNTKNTIIDSDLGLSFINQLRPVSFKKNNQGDSIHYGLIAQEVEDVIINTGKSLEEFSAISKPTDKTMGIAYSEFISPLIKAIQELSAKVTALEAK